MITALGCDPGKGYCALAWFVDGTLQDVAVLKADSNYELGRKVREWVPGTPSLLVVERQQLYRTTPNPNALLPLAETVGIITAVIPANEVMLPLPRTWKGSLKKAVFSEQLALSLSEADHRILARLKTKEARGHALDAVGLARWGLDARSGRG